MKKVFLAAVTLISVAFVGTANAQTPASATVTVNIKLTPIHTIQVTGDQSVDLVYNSEAKYSSGATSMKNDQLQIFSTGAFEVKVKSTAFDNTGGQQTSTIDASTVKVTASRGTGNNLSLSTPPTVALSSGEQTFIESTVGGRDLKFNVNYEGAGGDAYINKYSKYYNAPAENVYTATVTYTLMAK